MAEEINAKPRKSAEENNKGLPAWQILKVVHLTSWRYGKSKICTGPSIINFSHNFISTNISLIHK